MPPDRRTQIGDSRARELPSVLYVIQYRDFSGAEIMHAPLMQADPTALLACPPDSPTENFAKGLGVATVPLPFRSLRYSAGPLDTGRSVVAGVRSALDLRRTLRAHPERRIVFCTSVRPAMLGALAAIGLRRRVVWCVPDFLPPRPLRWGVRALARMSAARVLCVSEAIAEDFVAGSRRLGRRTQVINPGVDGARFAGSRQREAQRGAIVGHVSPTKRTDLAVEVARRVVARLPSFRLRIVGKAQFRPEDFELERRLKEEVGRDRVLADVIDFDAGHRGDVAGALEGCGLLLHCRPDEPFGIVLVEAMALGMPVVAPASAGPAEIVVPEVTGLLYRPGDAADAARCVFRIASDPGLASRMGAAGRDRATSRFTVKRQLELTRTLIAGAAA